MARKTRNAAEVLDTNATETTESTNAPLAAESGASLLSALGALTGGTEKRTRTSPRTKAYNAAIGVIVSYQEHHAGNGEVSDILARLRGEVEALRDAQPEEGETDGTGLRGRVPTVHVVCGKDDGSLEYVALQGKAPNRANIPDTFVSCYGPFRNEKAARNVVEKGISGREAFRLF